MIDKIIVVGGGSAGLLCAMGLKTKMPDLQVHVVRSEEVGEIGLECSTIPLTRYLHGLLGIDMRQFVQLARPTWKLGMRFLHWGPREHYYFPFGAKLDQRLPNLPRNIAFYCDADMDYATPLSALMAQDNVFHRTPPRSTGSTGSPQASSGQATTPAWQWDFAYHLDNESFVNCLRTLSGGLGVEVLDDTVRQVTQDESGITGLIMDSGQIQKADLYIDCSGPQSLLLGQTLKEPFVSFKTSLLCDRVVVGGWERGDESIHPFMTCQTMDSGWCWQIELERRINRGYVYSSSFVSDGQAEEEFRRTNPKIGPTRVVKFIGGRYERGWIKNVVAIGSSEGVVEPLHATGMGMIAARSQLLSEILMETGRQVPTAHVKLYNRHHGRIWEGIRRLLSIHYKYNTGRQQTPFWEACRRDVDLAGAEPIVEYYRQCGPNSLWGPLLIDPVDPFGAGGYLTVMVGQKLPTKVAYEPSTHEKAVWAAEQQRYRQAALQGLSVTEALAALPPYESAVVARLLH